MAPTTRARQVEMRNLNLYRIAHPPQRAAAHIAWTEKGKWFAVWPSGVLHAQLLAEQWLEKFQAGMWEHTQDAVQRVQANSQTPQRRDHI